MSKLSDQFNAQKPWAWLRMSRAQYMRAKPWKNTGLTREEFEKLTLALPQDVIETMYEHARADMLVDAIFKGCGVEE